MAKPHLHERHRGQSATTPAAPGARATLPGTHTMDVRQSRTDAERPAHDAFSEVPAQLRREIALAAQAASGVDVALQAVIALLVPGSTERRAAIVEAFTTNEALRAQWLRTYEILRNEHHN